ncbi:DMT family transporter [Marinobacterium jannaschii]|uniref:DMT family transporter n=1 Tax=Marinobacterium jannaschii TaxID=64970 RepID=UPI000685ECA7|nr:DMT family transporter [Marinobacterium jannaschii]
MTQPQPRDNHLLKGYLFAIGATLIWSGNFIIAKGLSDQIPPIGLAFWRWVVAFLGLLPFVIGGMAGRLQIMRKHFLYLSAVAITGVSVFNTLIYIGGHTTTAINLSLMAISAPMFMILLARFCFGEKITPRKALGTLVTASGVVVLVTGGSVETLLHLNFARGDLWVLISAICFAVYTMLIRIKPAEITGSTLLFASFLLGLLYLTPFYIWEHFTQEAVHFTENTSAAILYIGLGASLISYHLWNNAVAILGPTKPGLLYYLVPLFASFSAWLFLGESITLVHVTSLSLIIGGILLANR